MFTNLGLLLDLGNYFLGVTQGKNVAYYNDTLLFLFKS